jgi:nicotinate-nucleotide adenylyltransferase
MKNVGLFGGSFDPLHFGHLDLAIQMLEQHGLDEVLFCPAYCSPFKLDRPPEASGEERFAMLKVALHGVPRCRVTSVEVDERRASYTVETLRKLIAASPEIQYRLILTEESAAALHTWKEPEEIRRLGSPLIGKREFPISSTEIRQRLKKKLYCGHLVPEKALYYIEKHGLYSSLL